MTKNQRIADLLQRYFDSCLQTVGTKAFFLNVFDYWDLCLKCPELNAVVAKITSEKEEAQEPLNDALNDAKSEALVVRDDLRKYVLDHNIQSVTFDKCFGQIERYVNGEVVSSTPLPRKIVDILCDVVRELLKTGHKSIANVYCQYSPEDQSQPERILISPALDRYYDLSQEFDRNDDIHQWTAVSDMRLRHYTMGRGADDYQRLHKENQKNPSAANFSVLMNLGLLVSLWEDIRKGKDQKGGSVFNTDRIRDQLQRLHNRLLRDLLFFDWNAEEGAVTEIDDDLLHGFQPVGKIDKSELWVQLYQRKQWFKIGGLKTKKSRLFMILFNADADPRAPYSPVRQSVTRVYHFMNSGKFDHSADDSVETPDMEQAIKIQLKELQSLDGLRGVISIDFEKTLPTFVKLRMKGRLGSRSPLAGIKNPPSPSVAS